MPSSSFSSNSTHNNDERTTPFDHDNKVMFVSSSTSSTFVSHSHHHHHYDNDCEVFTNNYDATSPPVELDMSGHDTHLLGPKVVMLDSFVVDLLNVDTSAQTFKLKLILNMDWEDDGIIEPEYKAKRNLGRTISQKRRESMDSILSTNTTNTNTTTTDDNNNYASGSYRTGKYVLKQDYREDPLTTTWNPEVVLMNGIADESPIEAGSNFHSVQMLAGRPVISRSVLYQPECRCAFSFSNFPFDETDLVVKFGSNKWSSEQVQFIWTQRLEDQQQQQEGKRVGQRNKSILRRGVAETAVGGVGLSEFEIIEVRVECDEVDVNSLHKYDNADGAFSHAHLIIRVRRDPYSYLLRVSSVAELLMFLEVLSFLSDNDDLAARFSISGTIFLAMVSLYGPMADALPKVSVVTRVDKWHLQNFVLLFASNVENLLAYMLSSHTIVNEHVVNIMEKLLAIVYLYLVVQNLIWFVKPLKERDDFLPFQLWLESRLDTMKASLHYFSVIAKIFPSRKKNSGSGNAPTTTVGDNGRLDDQEEVAVVSSTRGTVRRMNAGGGAMTRPALSQEKND